MLFVMLFITSGHMQWVQDKELLYSDRHRDNKSRDKLNVLNHESRVQNMHTDVDILLAGHIGRNVVRCGNLNEKHNFANSFYGSVA